MRLRLRFAVAVTALLLSPILTVAQDQTAPDGGAQSRGGPLLPANQPAPRNDARHRTFLEIAQGGNIELLFVGDSITDWFSNRRGNSPRLGPRLAFLRSWSLSRRR